MPDTLTYSLMAGGAYISNRQPVNQFPIPVGWFSGRHEESITGFEGVSFFNGPDITKCSEIVISFAGTDGVLSRDQFANLGLASGAGSPQLFEAAAYYLKIKALNPSAPITFTGHSLGGGLASLIAVFFDKTAQTFKILGVRDAMFYKRMFGANARFSGRPSESRVLSGSRGIS